MAVIETGKMELRYVDPDRLHPNPAQPRENFDKEGIRELAESIKEHGILQPLVVREEKGGYEIIAGERRWRAGKLAKAGRLPILVRDTPEENVLIESLIENLQREDLDDISREKAITQLWESGHFKDQEALAKAISVTGAWVSQNLHVARIRENEPEIARIPQNTDKFNKPIPTSRIVPTLALSPLERKVVLEEAETYRLTQPEIYKRVKDIKESHAKGMEPTVQSITVVQGKWLLDRFKSPCEDLLTINLSAYKELSDGQKRELTSVLRRLQARLSQWLEKLE